MREWIADGGDRAELFIGSKIGPGGACWPLGHNESITQAKMIVGFYDELNSSAGRSPPAVGSVGQLDTLLIHWPVNGLPANTLLGPPGRMPWPCGCATGSSIPTTDPACDLSLPTYDERGCRVRQPFHHCGPSFAHFSAPPHLTHAVCYLYLVSMLVGC